MKRYMADALHSSMPECCTWTTATFYPC